MWGDIIWAAAFVTVCSVGFFLYHRRSNGYLEIHRSKQEAELKKSENSTALEKATIDERAELERARLRQAAAEARTATQVAESSDILKAKEAEEKMVIEARGEGRAQAAKEGALREESDAKTRALVTAYAAYIDKFDNHDPFDKWLGNVDLRNFSAKQLEALAKGYKAFVKDFHDRSTPFHAWIGTVDTNKFL